MYIFENASGRLYFGEIPDGTRVKMMTMEWTRLKRLLLFISVLLIE